MTEQKVTDADLSHVMESILSTLSEGALAALIILFKEIDKDQFRVRPRQEFMRMKVMEALRAKLQKNDVQVGDWLRQDSPAVRLLSTQSEEMLRDHKSQWYALFGKPLVILAMRCDIRESIRTLAKAWAKEEGAQLPEKEEAETFLKHLFTVFASSKTSSDTSAQLRQQLLAERTKCSTLEKDIKALKRQLEAANRSGELKYRGELNTVKHNLAERDKIIQALQDKLAHEVDMRETRVSQLLATRQTQLFHGWLAPTLANESLAQTVQSQDLFQRIDAALELQAEYDRAAAIGQRLQSHLEQYEARLLKIDETLHHSLRPHPQLQQIREELVSEINRLRMQLKQTVENPVVRSIEAQINSATTEEQYAALEKILPIAKQAALISAIEARDLRTLLQRRLATLDLGVAVSKAEDEEETRSAAIEKRHPELVKALAGTAPLHLYLDGHNMLNGLGRYKQRRGMAMTHTDARMRMEKDLCHFLNDLPLTHTHLVWDGGTKSDYTLSDNATGHFSGGEGEHRADRYILDMIKYQRTLSEEPILLVTDDNGFAAEAQRLGAKVCRLHDFEAFLNAPAH